MQGVSLPPAAAAGSSRAPAHTVPTDPAGITDDEESLLERLLASEGLRVCESAPPPSVPGGAAAAAPPGTDVQRDCLVIDAALGGRAAWTTEVASSEVDFVEERADGWAASVSVIVSLLSTASAPHAHMHDETAVS